MSKRLLKIAKELNVGTTTIVEFLVKIGFEIENKPNANVSEEMHTALLDRFSQSIAEKEKADKLVLPNTKAEEPKKEKFVAKEDRIRHIEQKELLPKSTSSEIEADNQKIEVVNTVEPVVVTLKIEDKIVENSEQEKETVDELDELPSETIKNSIPPIGLKIVDKIDLASISRKPKQKKSMVSMPNVEETGQEFNTIKDQEKTKEETTIVQIIKEEIVVESNKSDQKSEEVPIVVGSEIIEPSNEMSNDQNVITPPVLLVEENENLIKGVVPQLQGLKILGKIDTKKFEPKRKEKTPNTPKPILQNPNAKEGVKQNTQNVNGVNDDKAKRKRKRKTVPPPAAIQSNDAKAPIKNKPNFKPKKGIAPTRKVDDIQQVSQREVDEKIKLTLAKLHGSSKSARQKIRRESRIDKREREELRNLENETEVFNVTEFITVSELANLFDISPSDVIMTCMNVGVFVSINQRLDAEIIKLIASEFEKEVEFVDAESNASLEDDIEDAPESLIPRSPIVTVMGHVDHGKTSLLDYIRKTNVVSGEAGGITQHIGAHEVVVNDKRVTFLDTPGHEAFTAMRARGAKVTDIAIIIIAADDHIMPQTKEAISHAQAANVPMVFAINKIDKEGANPQKIKEQLSGMNLLIEEWGGTYQSHDISAKSGIGVKELLEKVVLEAEMLELKANPNKNASGTVLEASLDKGRGYVAKLLVQAGTLKVGDCIVAGSYYGKVKAMFNERGKKKKDAGPSTPIGLLGFNGAPSAGEIFKVTDTEQEARQIATKREQLEREQANRSNKRISLDEIGRRLALGSFKELKLIVKGDVDGSTEALSDALIRLSIDKVKVSVIHKAVGQVIESDVLLASASDAIIIGFQVRPSAGARNLAEKEGVQIKSYSIIYEAIEEIKMAIEGLLEPDKEEKVICSADIKEIFKNGKFGTIAGCLITEGTINRNTKIRIIRDGIVVYPVKEGVVGEIGTLKRFKDDIKEVKSGMECGLTVKNFDDIKVNDVVEGYEVIEIKKTYASEM